MLTVPDRFAKIGDPHAAMDEHAGVLDALLEMAAREEAEGVGDAPWPPHYEKQAGEGKRVAPSKAKKFADQMGEGFGAKRFRKQAKRVEGAEGAEVDPAVGGEAAAGEAVAVKKKGVRKSKMPLIVIAQSPDKAAAEAGLERWKAAHAEAAALLAADDVLVDRMRGSAYVWYRIRVNLRNVPEAMRPAQGVVDPDEDPTRGWREGGE